MYYFYFRANKHEWVLMQPTAKRQNMNLGHSQHIHEKQGFWYSVQCIICPISLLPSKFTRYEYRLHLDRHSISALDRLTVCRSDGYRTPNIDISAPLYIQVVLSRYRPTLRNISTPCHISYPVMYRTISRAEHCIA